MISVWLTTDLEAPHVGGFFAEVKYFPTGDLEEKVNKIITLKFLLIHFMYILLKHIQNNC